MRALLLALLFANLVFYGAVNGWLGESVRVAVVPEQREPTRVAQQMAASHLELLVPKAPETPSEAAGAVVSPGAVPGEAGTAGAAPGAAAPAGAAPGTAAGATAPGSTAPAVAPGTAAPAGAAAAPGRARHRASCRRPR